ncbi:MAG: 16S rRNA (cytosine(1402)-N(4))-methyltransferase RsmH [Patescibacteria group bacterium]|nr:16S rRNA (cytosine(1402)-N(4))-methyltransferase RsmH [Patescibacteria group bacterium]
MKHIPVLMAEVIEGLNLESNTNVIDCTLGDAGHAEIILEKIGPKGQLLGIDADPESLLRAKRNLYKFGERVIYARDNFVNLTKIVSANKFTPVSAVLMDLGWSTPQFAERGRGFSFEPPAGGDEPLDMRYDPNDRQNDLPTAADILNKSSEAELAKIFKNYGEEKFSRDIAEEICRVRKTRPLEQTKELVEIILSVYRTKLNSKKDVPWIGGIHPATKVFQALRLAVNRELEVLKQALPQALDALTAGGRLAVITFHSLEDRIVKQYFQSSGNVKIINKKPLVASAEEIAANPRSRSAKLRVVEKI